MTKVGDFLVRLLLLGALVGIVAGTSWLLSSSRRLDPWSVTPVVAIGAVLPIVLAQWALRRRVRPAETFQDSFPDEEPPDPPETVTYCAGLPLVVERPLTPDERARMKQVSRISRAGGCLLALAMATFFVFMLVMMTRWDSTIRRNDSQALAAGGCLLLIVGTTFLYIFAKDRLKRGRKLRRTLRAGYLRRFEGFLREFDPTETAFRKLKEAKLLPDDSDRPTAIELFPHINEVYSIDDVPVPDGVVLEVTQGAPRPEEARLWDIPSEWTGGEGDSDYKRRRSSPEERRELARYARLDRKFWGVALLLVFSTYMSVGGMLAMIKVPYSICFPAAVGAAWFVYVEFIWERVRKGRRFLADIDFGWLWVARYSPPEEDGPNPEPGPVVEYLAVAGLIWTIDGKPAAWRGLEPPDIQA